MSAVEALGAARAVGVRLAIDGDDLMLEAAAPPPDRVLDLLARHKAGILALLRQTEEAWSAEDWQAYYGERAGVAEFDAGLPRDQAESRAFACCVARWLDRNPVPSPLGRCLGCRAVEQANDPLLPFGTGLCGHAHETARPSPP